MATWGIERVLVISSRSSRRAWKNGCREMRARVMRGFAMALEIDSDAYPADMLFDILNALGMPVFVYELNGDEQLPVFMNRQCLDLLEADSLEDAIESCNGDFKEYVSPNDRKLVNKGPRTFLWTTATPRSPAPRGVPSASSILAPSWACRPCTTRCRRPASRGTPRTSRPSSRCRRRSRS